MGDRASRWWVFIRERFPLASHVPMVGLFTLGNAALAAKLGGRPFSPELYGVAFVVAFLFFFRLRCFDEIKDYEVDCAVNPTRPLARGVLSIGTVKKMIAVLALTELGIVSLLGRHALVMHAVAVGYSFLMYKEFFIGRHLRPHLTTYAVTHTFVSVLLGWSIAAQTTGLGPEAFPGSLWLLGPVNWLLFNLFEFARKTFAPSEERPHVESYSSLFGPLGSSLLSLSQIGCALYLLSRLGLPALAVQLVVGLAPCAAALFYVSRRTGLAARVFRGVTGAYLLLFYGLLAWQGLGL